MATSLNAQAFAAALATISSSIQPELALDVKENSCPPHNPRPKFVPVPDCHNIVKYFFAIDENPAAPKSQPLPPPFSAAVAFQFGVVADVQYANFPVARGVKRVTCDGVKVLIRRRRAWREAIPKLVFAVQAFNKAGVDFVVNLGDLIEGNGLQQTAQNKADICLVLDVFRKSKSKVYHCIGNHCRQLPISILQRAMRLKTPYYSFCPTSGWRNIVLNAAELSGMVVGQTEKERSALSKIVEEEKRGVHHFHGAIGQTQLGWLAQQLDEARAAREYVIIFSHYPLADEAARSSHVLANTKAVRSIIERPGSPVVLCLAGHDHLGKALNKLHILLQVLFCFLSHGDHELTDSILFIYRHMACVYIYTPCRRTTGCAWKRFTRTNNLCYDAGNSGGTSLQ